jgi:hypothetical protein
VSLSSFAGFLCRPEVIVVALRGSVALGRTGAREARSVNVRSDRSGEFGERGSDAPVPAGVDPEFVVASPEVLNA